ncbi:xanthine phosphoribosyltransferase [Heliophilum fasciatum]|uniref:Xanthine phosphoribosyltransferase n=1 Tax=Heliophilum fasciatum TaxID=35700 RepID=A0A4R2RFX2_9FIRM|nr:xanthine phosphoribosyltransferase [Heliophilum fasciatum]MCW2279198.1 xanthine phosphoribosyltransferase [Heliophilum fasciatum]TCP60987.1 xanthine phosphoribosyltransferase [Heliophilum fasciatum]
MRELKNRILQDGKVIGPGILDVSAFLNHQVDPALVMRMGQALAERFAQAGVTRVLTVEASGIPVAVAAGFYLGVPVVFAKKKKASTQGGALYRSPIFSFTRQETVEITVSGQYLLAADVVLIIDDFLAHGEALQGLVDVVRQAGAQVAGAGIVIEKRFQGGAQALRDQGLQIEALAAITRMEPGCIEFAE